MLSKSDAGILLKNPLDCKEIKPVNPKGNQPWIFIGRNDAEADAPIPWPSDAKRRLIGKDPDARKDWGQEKGTTDDETMDGITNLNSDMSLRKLRELEEDRKAWRATVHGVAKSWTWLSDWITTPFTKISYIDLPPLPLRSYLSELFEMFSTGLQPSFCTK